MKILTWAAAALALICGHAVAEDEVAPYLRPVRVVADQRITVGNEGRLPLYVSSDWSHPLPDIIRAVLILHGRLRNADVFTAPPGRAQAAAGATGAATLMIVPQFLADIDIEAHHLPADTLRWTLEGWEGGDDATGPRPASSFEASIEILARLADRSILCRILTDVVVAGHSSGPGGAALCDGQLPVRRRLTPRTYRRALCRRQSLVLRLLLGGAPGA